MTAPSTPQLIAALPSIAGDDLSKMRTILRFLGGLGFSELVAQEGVARLASARDENGTPIFSDHTPGSPHVVLAEQLAHAGALSQFYASNIPLLIEDYLLSMSGELPLDGLPEYVWLVYRLTSPRPADYTITRGKQFEADGGQLYEAVYDLTIPNMQWGDEVNADGTFLYQQLYRAATPGLAGRIPSGTLKTPRTSIPYVERAFNPQASFGGRDPEGYDEFRVRAFQSPRDNLLITPGDYVQAVRRFLGPGARVIVIGEGREGEARKVNEVRIAAIAPNGEIVDPAGAGVALRAYLQERDPNSDVVIKAPLRTAFALSMTVVLEANATADEESIKPLVKAELRRLLSPLVWRDWGEKENQFDVNRLLGEVVFSIRDIDRIILTRLDVRETYDRRGSNMRYTGPFPAIELEPTVGLPSIDLESDLVITVTRERR